MRPADWGREFLNDSTDNLITTILDQISVPSTIINPNVGTYYVPDFPDGLRKLNSDAFENQPFGTLRDVYYGTVMAILQDSQFEVALQTGNKIVATQFKSAEDDKFNVNEVVIVVRGNQPDQWFVQALGFLSYTRQYKIVQVLEDFLMCTDEEGNDIKVARSFTFWKENYNGKKLGDKTYTYVNNLTRKFYVDDDDSDTQDEDLEPTVYQKINLGYYNIGDKITGLYLPFGLSSKVDGDTNWIDANVNGHHWVTMAEVRGESTDILFRDDGYVTIDHVKIFDKDDDKYLSTLIAVDSELRVWNTFNFECSEDDIIIAEYRGTNEYHITKVLPKRRIFIRFVLTGTLTKGGNALAKIRQKKTTGGTMDDVDVITVYDELNKWDGVADYVGYAEWKHDSQKYEIYALNCSET